MKKIIVILLFVFCSAAHAGAEDVFYKIIGLPPSTDAAENRNAAARQAEEDRQAAVDKAYDERIKAEDIQKEKNREERAEALRKGSVSPETIVDLNDLYESPEDGWDLAASPKLDADKEVYLISGIIEKRENGLLLCATLPAPEQLIGNYFAIRINAKTRKPTDIKDRLRINGRVFVVGRYVNNLEYNTAGAGQKIMPVLDAVHLVIPED